VTLRYGADDGQVRALMAWRILTADVRLVNQALDLANRQHHRCYLCGDRFKHAPPRGRQSEPKIRTRDHVFPRRVRGGGDANILLAHDDCNQAKGDRWPYPCEVIYLAAVYAAPLNRQMVHAMRVARIRAERRVA
jgi:hypothetical protein